MLLTTAPLGGLMARMIVADREYVTGKYKLHKLKGNDPSISHFPIY